jgi:hypothetical protein
MLMYMLTTKGIGNFSKMVELMESSLYGRNQVLSMTTLLKMKDT